jgi:hypothetical protein
MIKIDILFAIFKAPNKKILILQIKNKCWHHRWRQHHEQCHANRLENRSTLKSELFQELKDQYYSVLKLEVEI